MSTDCQKTTAKAIPSTRRVTINDAAHMPLDYSTTPGGTLFSTTPGVPAGVPQLSRGQDSSKGSAQDSRGDDSQFEMDV
ncbi:hypothetical protein FQN60_017681 [Etheostoma spectabile]|uniref:Uncharacterized protein n=1 Tax=Etheostoma spectabile TaxID=54343 RepID=A0A5J5DFW6_9PERO|nr:hypothetical protein FQN60_017681 [Etheostoma spectabile]